MTPHSVMEIFLGVLGACVGSFLNVVAYRLPAGMSVSKPARSFCPHCRRSIAWYDNVPVLSWLVLRARCRQCGAPISVQYPLVEAATAAVFVLVYHLLFVLAARDGFVPDLLRDWPLLLSWLTLAAALVACAVMDIASYSVDVRVTNITLGAGVLLAMIWPRPDLLRPVAETPLAAAALAAGLATLLMMHVQSWRESRAAHGVAHESSQSTDAPAVESGANGAPLAARLGLFGILALVALSAAIVIAPAEAASAASSRLASLPVVGLFVVLFLLLVVAGGHQRDADAEIEAAIEEERAGARAQALRELAWLVTPLILAVGAYLLAARSPVAWRGVALGSPGADVLPLAGVAYAAHGVVMAAAAGWALRIIFTLVFGREAFGVGDIYILAAAGACAGAEIALLGLLLSIGIALAGWILGLLLKSTVMIPFGPWLALGFLAALWLHRPAMALARTYADSLSFLWQERPDMVLAGVGVLLAGSVGAVILARLMRRLIERAA